MSKHLLFVIVAFSIAMVVMTAATFVAMLALVRAPWWWCVIAALAVFVEGVYFFTLDLVREGYMSRTHLHRWFLFLQGAMAYYVAVALNRLLNKTLHLNVITHDALIDLLNQSYDLAEASHQIARLEAEREELQVSEPESEVQA